MVEARCPAHKLVNGTAACVKGPIRNSLQLPALDMPTFIAFPYAYGYRLPAR